VDGLPSGVTAVMGRASALDESETLAALKFRGWSAEKARAWLHAQGFMALLEAAPADVAAPAAPAAQPRALRREDVADNLSMRVHSMKAMEKKAFGWLYVVERADGTKVVDWSGEVISERTMEVATYDYVLNSRLGGCMHIKDPATGLEVQAAVLCECICFTHEKRQLFGIPDGVGPHIGTWIGLQFTDDAVWARVLSGELRMFSLSGWAVPVPFGGT